MRSWLFVFLIACGGGNKPTTQPPVSTPPATGSEPATQPMMAADTAPTCAEANVACAITALSYFSKQMCACKDAACANKTNDGMTRWGEDMAKMTPTVAKPTADEQKQIVDVVTKYSECMTKLTGGPPQMTDPCGGGNPCGD